MKAARDIALLALKDLRIEARARRGVALVVILGVLIVAVLALGLGDLAAAPGTHAGAILWVAYLFAGVLCFERSMDLERQDDALAALLLAPVDRGSLFFAKLLANLLLLSASGAIVTLVAIVFLDLDLTAAPLAFARITLLSLVGLAAVGTLFSAAAASSRRPAGVLGVLLFPLCLPLVLASTRALDAHLAGPAPPTRVSAEGIVIAFDVVFIVAGWLLYEVVLEPEGAA